MWIKNKNASESLVILRTLSLCCKELGRGALCDHLYDLVMRDDFQALVSFDIDYSAGYSLTDYQYARQILGFYQKADFLPLNTDRAAVAARRFELSEVMCRSTNERFRTARRENFKNVLPAIRDVLNIASRKITSVLGPVPSVADLSFAFGPGANTNVKGTRASPRAKLSAALECSSTLTPTVGELLSEAPQWVAIHSKSESEDSYTVDVSVTPGKVIFVPKNAKTDRSIVVEPLLNSFFQKGYGSFVKERLLRSGIDLYDQTRNQMLAQRGSVDGALCTVDLSMASDCMASELVNELLPPEWVDILTPLATREVLLPSVVDRQLLPNATERELSRHANGFPYRLEKFSSMGNGFTFELESTIFYGLAHSVCRYLSIPMEDISVYGDDIIVPVEAYALLSEVLAFCGFSVNLEKSFALGPFRESCGADYFLGSDIRPFYQKTLVSGRTLFTMHNWFLRHGEYELARIAENFCDPTYRLYGPDGFGDGHLIGSFHGRLNRTALRAGWGGVYFDTYSLNPRSFRRPLPGDAVLPVYSVYTRSGKDSPTDPNVVRGSNGYAKISVYTLSPYIFR